MGDHVALEAGKNREYDPEIIKCYKGLIKYAFKFMLNFDSKLEKKTNSRNYCYEVNQ